MCLKKRFLFLLPLLLLSVDALATTRHLSLEQYRDKMKGGWVGQMIGVGWGAPTEFRYNGKMIPKEDVPSWQPGMVNQFAQDDIYVEMTFLHTMEKALGGTLSIREAGIDFANSAYPLWHANRYGRDNLRRGIAPPDSGHPQFNQHADDIDYQIEADFAGLVSPGLPQEVLRLANIFGRLMNYGDGLYGGIFVGAMYAEAFFESDIERIIKAGLASIPQGSQYHECISDVLRWHQEEPQAWEKVWEKIDHKYQHNPDYRRFCCSGTEDPFNIDAKINGAYIVMGLLYGQGDLEKTIRISMRCGLDSDCNPSNAAGIIGTILGFETLEERFTQALDEKTLFSHTPYAIPDLLQVCERLALDAVQRAGGSLESDQQGGTCLRIPVQTLRPYPLEQCWEAGPIANSRYSQAERKRILKDPWILEDGSINLDTIFTGTPFEGWRVRQCGQDMDPGFRLEAGLETPVLLTHPMDKETPCILSRRVAITKEGPARLRLKVKHHPGGDCMLRVKADGATLFEQLLSKETQQDAWGNYEISLTPYVNKTILLEIFHEANDWAFEAAYWAEIRLD